MSRLSVHRRCIMSVDGSRGGSEFLTKPASARGALSPVMILGLIIGIVIALIIFGVFAMGEIVDSTYDDVDVTVRVSGNDVMVTVIGGNDVVHVTGIRAYIDGSPEISAREYQPIESLGSPILFTDLAKGVSGSAFVIVEAAFEDGTRGIINYARLQFN